MSKQKVVSSLLLSTVVLGGLAFYSTTTVKAESLESDVTSVSSGDVVEKPVVSTEEESDFLAEEEELEDDEPLEEELNEKAEEVTEPSALELIPQPRAMRSVLEDSEMESFPTEDSESESVMTIKGLDQVQDTNRSGFLGKAGQENYRSSVSIEPISVTSKGEVSWKVTFNPQGWSFHKDKGGYYLLVPKGLTLTKITENNSRDITNQFPTNVNSESNGQQAPFRFFGGEEVNSGERSFGEQWNWSVGLVSNNKFNEWKNYFSSIYYIDNPKHTDTVEYVLTAQMKKAEMTNFPLMAVIKNFDEKNHSFYQVVAIAGREVVIEKAKVQKPKEEAPAAPKEDTPAPPAPSVPEAPQTPQTPEADQPKVIVPEKKAPEAEQPETVNPEPKKPEVNQPKVEDPKAEVPKDKVPEVQHPETKEPEVETAPETKSPEVIAPKADTPKVEQTPEADQPKVIVPEEKVPEVEQSETVKPEPKKPEVSTPKVEVPKDKVPEVNTPKVEEPKTEVPEISQPKQDAPKESPKQEIKEDAETYEPKVLSEWLTYTNKTPHKDAQKKILDSVIVPEATKPVVKTIIGDVPLELGEHAVQVKVQYQDNSYDIAIVDVRIISDAPHETPKVDNQPETKSPEVITPKADAPKVEQTPETTEPKTDAPKVEERQEIVKPEVDQPKVEEPKVEVPMDKFPEVNTPKDEEPKVDNQPETKSPEVTAPKADTPKVEQTPKTTEPKTDAPKVDKQSETVKPEPKKPELNQPKVEEPKAEVPKDKVPEVNTPKVEEPKVDKQPEMKSPEVRAPKLDQPQMKMPEVPRSEKQSPKTSNKVNVIVPERKVSESQKPQTKVGDVVKGQMNKATLPNTGEASGGLTWLGGALATLVTGLYLFKNKKEE
ncbi:LPXTG cell wall anchor domain-containing protein [Streptococcus suis]|uniref:LPXTG cell wall anchor domain-containing protein n=1 Tax=Streptococcus suis TaxID=1307 RepID=UPI002AAC650D|nr:LPXTG cell wall anchor domain-containing protein [Streptococcus suis]MDY7283943.1 LPXTG cell wall anchor domain-containing protein [Streptococcus suis]